MTLISIFWYLLKVFNQILYLSVIYKFNSRSTRKFIILGKKNFLLKMVHGPSLVSGSTEKIHFWGPKSIYGAQGGSKVGASFKPWNQILAYFWENICFFVIKRLGNLCTVKICTPRWLWTKKHPILGPIGPKNGHFGAYLWGPR